MIDVLFVLIALAVAIVVILVWRHVHREHQEWRRLHAEKGAEAVTGAETEERAGPEKPAEVEEGGGPGPAPPHGAEQPPHAAAAAESVIPSALPKGWSLPQPAHVPRPTYWPGFLAISAVWMGWGAISNVLFIYAGFVLFLVAITCWIREMLHAE